ncbi:MAG TPA: DUF3536 domain-containing protein [Actinomycetota bacterium]|nr:DUF3536 domain-containing protein [Actinomycetota bacterium]
MAARIVVHGHFYQPPREDPWTGQIDPQPTAAPFHDWNERVHAESYLNNVFADLETEAGEVVVNNFERLSFNVGPTLMSWMEKMHPRTYARILHADSKSIERLGRGNAIAQSFHHTILPLSNMRDVRTEVRWGLADFRYRFSRDAEGIWLPETAVNDDVLGILIEEGVAFTILAPYQAGAWRRPGEDWVDVPTNGIDTRVAYRYLHPDGSGRSLSLFFYDGDIAKAIAFENAMVSAEGFIDMFASHWEDDAHLIHAATDGETYGHHQKFGEIGLAYALFVAAEQRGVEVTNYSAYLEKHPAELEAKLAAGEGTSWSCAHGVARWKEDCGCVTGGEPGWDQRWRAPLRGGLDIIRVACEEVFERLGASLFNDPWAARDDYVDVVLGAGSFDDFLAAHAARPVDDAARSQAQNLLELQRNSMSMFTSCGWFFSDVAGIESVQVLRYAARTLDLLDALGQPSPKDEAMAILAKAKSNQPAAETAADLLARALAR